MFADDVESVSVRRMRENLFECGGVGADLLDAFRRGVVSLDELLLLSQVVVGGEWRERAACRGMDPELFFPVRGQDTRVAKAVCGSCEVRGECGEYARVAGEPHGIWGGVGARSRRAPKPTTVGCLVCAKRFVPGVNMRTPLCSDECRVRWNRLRHAVYRVRQSGVA